jgi:hypothetical protein
MKRRENPVVILQTTYKEIGEWWWNHYVWFLVTLAFSIGSFDFSFGDPQLISVKMAVAHLIEGHFY